MFELKQIPILWVNQTENSSINYSLLNIQACTYNNLGSDDSTKYTHHEHNTREISDLNKY